MGHLARKAKEFSFVGWINSARASKRLCNPVLRIYFCYQMFIFSNRSISHPLFDTYLLCSLLCKDKSACPRSLNTHRHFYKDLVNNFLYEK